MYIENNYIYCGNIIIIIEINKYYIYIYILHILYIYTIQTYTYTKISLVFRIVYSINKAVYWYNLFVTPVIMYNIRIHVASEQYRSFKFSPCYNFLISKSKK